MPGAGFSRFGLDPAGLPSNGRSAALSDDAAPVACRAIDTRRRDYLRGTGDAFFIAMPIIAQRVLEAVGNRVGSFSGDPLEGDPSLTIGKDNGKLQATVTAYTRERLSGMVKAGEIELLSVTVDVVSGAYKRTITFRDTSTNQVLTA